MESVDTSVQNPFSGSLCPSPPDETFLMASYSLQQNLLSFPVKLPAADWILQWLLHWSEPAGIS